MINDMKIDSPFKVIREEKSEEEICDVYQDDNGRMVEIKGTRITIRGYDKKNRMVSESIKDKYENGQEGHSFRAVESNGCWHGGAYSPIINQGCIMTPSKFELIDETDMQEYINIAEQTIKKSIWV